MKVIIIGGGQIGSYLGKILIENGDTVTVIEERGTLEQKWKETLPKARFMVGSGTDPKILEAAGIGIANVVASVTGADEVNLVAATIAKYEFGVSRVIARVNHPKNDWLFTVEMGVDVKVNQANILGHLIIDEMDLKNMSTLLKLEQGNHAIVEVTVEPGALAVDKQIQSLHFPEHSVLIAVNREHRLLIPKGDTILKSGDRILALTASAKQEEVTKIFAENNI